MSNVQFNIADCQRLVTTEAAAAKLIEGASRSLSPLLNEAYGLLERTAHPLNSPLNALYEASRGLVQDSRDLDWRLEFIKRLDGTGFEDGGRVAVTGMPDWTWEEAQQWYLASDIEKLWEDRDKGPAYYQQRRREQLEALIGELIGSDDPAAIAAIINGLREGEPIYTAIQNAGVRMEQAAHREAVQEYARETGLPFDEAEERFLELQQQIVDLVNSGLSPAEAASIVAYVDENGYDLDELTQIANDEGIEVVDALSLKATADHYAMTIPELQAYEGLNDHFDTFDNATGGKTDSLVSLDDLNYVVNNPGRFSAEEVAAAAALLANPELLRRLDTGRDNNDVLNDGNAFGDTSFDDAKISLEDIAGFEWKQGVNALVGTHYDEIDNVHGGEHDGHLSKADFQTYLANNRGSLTDQEINALEVVIDGEFYDKGWLERNKRSIAIATAVVAGAAIAGLSFGTLSGVSLVLVTAAASAGGGAAAAGATTLGINAYSDESDWDDDLGSNMFHGAMAGMAGGGLRVGAQHWVANPGTLSRTATGLGMTSDLAAITALGGLDPVIEVIPGVEHDDLDQVHDVAEIVSLTAGVYGVGATGVDATVRWYTGNMAESIARRSPHLVDSVSTFETRGMGEFAARQFLESSDGLPIMQAVFGEGLENFDPQAMRYLVQDVASGTGAPTLVANNPQELIKLIPEGTITVSPQSPFFAGPLEVDRVVDQQRSLADAFGLPLKSSADNYSIAAMAVPENAVLYESTVAPTSELYGNVRRNGGAQQILVFDRSAFPDPVVTNQTISNGGLAPHVPIREAATAAEGAINPPSSSGVDRDSFVDAERIGQ